MIFMSPFTSAIVRFSGSVIRVSKSTLKSWSLRWSRVNLLKRISSLLKMGSSLLFIEKVQLLFSIISMRDRNPFTSISNLSFVRNANHLSEGRPASRSYSSNKKYFDYQGPYLRDAYLNEWQVRHNQEALTSRVMGIEALRYVPTSELQPLVVPLQSSGEYYNLQTFSNAPDSLPIRSDHQSTLKSSTKDMFGSEYFKSRFGTQEDQKMDSYQVLAVRNTPVMTKNISNSRFKKTDQIRNSMQEEEIEESLQATQLGGRQAAKKEEVDEPQTLFLKSRGKTFYRYRFPNEDDY